MSPPRIALFYLLLILSSPIAYAAPQNGFTDTEKTPSLELEWPSFPGFYSLTPPLPSPPVSLPDSISAQGNSDIVLSFQSLPGGGSVCRFSELTPLEVQRFKDSILVPGLVGDEIAAGTQPNTEREKISDSNVLIVPNPTDKDSAFKKEIPNQILQPDELAPLLNQHVEGPFAFGISLYDTLRAAKCTQNGPCAVEGTQIQLRNSSEGISGNIKDIYNAFTSSGPGNHPLSQEDADLIQSQIEGEIAINPTDTNSLPAEVYSRTAGADVLNHIQVDNTFQAGMLTNCDKGTCVMTLYSMFDKYFNSFFSGQMVLGTFGPTLWGQFKKMLVKSKRFNLVSGTLTNKVATIFGMGSPSVGDIFKNGVPIGPNSFFSRYVKADKALTGQNKFLTIDGADYFRNLKQTNARDVDMGSLYDELFINQKVTSGGKYPGAEDVLFAPDGPLSKVTSYDDRLKLSKYTEKIGEHAQVTEKIRQKLEGLAKAGNPADRVNAARGYATLFKDMDDAINLDLKLTFKKLPEADFRKIIVVDKSTGLHRSLLDLDDKYFDDMMDNFIKTGKFDDVAFFEKSVTGNIKLYEFLPAGSPVGVADLTKVQGGTYPADAQVKLWSGEFFPATPDNYATILNDKLANGGRDQLLYQGGYRSKGELTPEDLANKILAGNIMDGKIKKYGLNAPKIYDTFVARGWVKGTYANILSKSLQSNEKLLSNYAKVTGADWLNTGLGITAQTYLYWWVVRGGPLGDNYSIYQLPKEWTQVTFEPGNTEFYNDAYIDFFANEGSDTGDIFQRVISNLPIAWILEQTASTNSTLQKGWDNLNGGNARTNPDNLATFMFGPPGCSNCSATIASPNKGRFDVQYVSPESIDGFFLEHAKTKEAKDKGQLILTFAHHTDIKGKANEEELSPINLVDARKNEETCQQVMDELPIYGWASRAIGSEKTGAVLAVTENIGYIFGGMMGTIVSLANQFAIAPKMANCVDDKEGYFASLYVPKENTTGKAGKADELQKSVSENALDGIREFANRVDQERNGQSLTDKVLKESTTKVKELVDDAQKDNVAEAELRITGSSSGYLRSKEVMYFWVGGEGLIEPAKYLTEGKTLLTTKDGHTITLDNTLGTLNVDGQEVIGEDKADHERLANKNLSIPAVEIPQRINGFQLGDTNTLLLTVNVRGEALVQDPALLNCIQEAVLAQSGVPLNSNNMSEAFGQTQSVSTDTYPSITVDSANTRIHLGGQVPQTAYGPSASIQLYGDRRVIVTGVTHPEAGKFNSGSWEDGTIVYKPQTNELLIWLRHHAQAVVSDQDVKALNGNLTTTTNPNTQCEEPAVDLSVLTDPNSPAAKLKGDNLTAGLKKNGPFQVFETPTKQFILYSKLVDGVCQSFFKVINKATGEVYDQAITDISQNPDGTIQIKTVDGKTHSLAFSEQNGKPVLTYDGNSELLNSASGKGGSFYYDPSKGLYYAENAQLIPLNDNFKNQGIGFQSNADGSVSGKAAGNVFNINAGQGGQGLFNIPSIPEDAVGAALVLLILIGIVLSLYIGPRRKKKDFDARKD